MTDPIVERRGDVIWVTLNRPDARNAMTFATYEGLAQTARDVDADRSVPALVPTGAGGASVAGTDIAQFAEFTREEDALGYERRVGRLALRDRTRTLPDDRRASRAGHRRKNESRCGRGSRGNA